MDNELEQKAREWWPIRKAELERTAVNPGSVFPQSESELMKDFAAFAAHILSQHPQQAGKEEPVAWPKEMVNHPEQGTESRIIGFRIREGDPQWGKYGLSEPLTWLQKAADSRSPQPVQVGQEIIDAGNAMRRWIEYAAPHYCDEQDRHNAGRVLEAWALASAHTDQK